MRQPNKLLDYVYIFSCPVPQLLK